MGENQQFINLLKPIKRQLLLQLILKEGQLLFMLTGALSFLLIAVGSFFVIPFLLYYFIAIFSFLTLFFLIRIWFFKPGLAEAANVYNSFVPEDRVITALSFLNNDGELEKLQLSDAVFYMKKVQNKVHLRKKFTWYPRSLLAGIALVFASVIVFYTIDGKFELSRLKEKEIKIVQKLEKQLEKKMEKEKDPEVKKELKEAKVKIGQKKSAEKALKELEKQSKQLELQSLKEKEKQKLLEKMRSDLNENDMANLASLLNQKDLNAFEKELKKLNNNWDQLSKKQQEALSELSQKEQKLSDEELEQLLKQIESALQSPETLKQLAAAQAAIQQAGTNAQKQMLSNGLPPSQAAFAPPGQANSGAAPGSSQNNNGKTGNKNGTGNGSKSGSGSGTGSGSGSGSGAGSGGSGAGGTGNGSGSGGSGAGSGQGSRELVTIPDRIKGRTNMETDSGKLGEGQSGQQSEGTGPILKGNIRPYSEVYDSYEKSYRQSTDRYELPEDLEDIVKNYFTNIDPNKE